MGASAAGDLLKVALDNHYSPLIAIRLRENGHDAIGAKQRGWDREEDEPLLGICADEGRVLVTNDVADFMAISRTWAAAGRSHPGLIFTSDASMPRSRNTIGRYVDALDDLLARHLGDEAFRDRVHWL